MKIAIPRETAVGETRVAATPETVKKLIGLGYEVAIETEAGTLSNISDAAYAEAGAELVSSSTAAVGVADVILKVQRPFPNEINAYPRGATLIGILSPYADPETVGALAAAEVTSLAMDFMPRITRAQSMDVLSSQSNLAGYKAVIDAAALFSRAFPMMMTAAGAIAPAKVFVMGAGVAGLQAIATAKRLGAVVTATDVRPAVKEQVESLGGTFIMVESEETESAETAGGYAREMSEDFQRRQAELVAAHIQKQDIVICTALIPGRAAPVLVSEEMVTSMQSGSIIVDLAVEQGGNCPLSELGKVVDVNGVLIMGYANMPGRLSADASSLYARNLLNFLTPFTNGDEGALALDWEDEIIKGVALTHGGAVIHPAFAPEPVAETETPEPANDETSAGED